MLDDSYKTLELSASGVISVALSADETRIFAARSDGQLNAYDAATGTLLTSWDVGISLGGMSLSEDGSYLLVTEQNPATGIGLLYSVDTASGAVTTISRLGNRFLDVGIVNSGFAILSGNQSQAALFDIAAGTFSPIANSAYYSNTSGLVEDKHLTLLAEPGISNGPLAIFDDRTMAIVARGDNYQAEVISGFNFGHAAISEVAGLVAQFSYYGAVNIYDLSLNALRYMNIGQPVDGLAFDPTGKYLFARSVSGELRQFDVATGELIEAFALPTTSWHNNYAPIDQLIFSDDAKLIVVHDNSTGRLHLIDLHQRDQNFIGSSDANTMTGGKGDDKYLVNTPDDVVIELAHGGIDTVKATVDYVLPDHVEKLFLDKTARIGTGNSSDNAITGTAGADTLNGLGGDDIIAGSGGKDTIAGGDGNDLLKGGDGADQIHGDNGNDRVEAGTGIDEVQGGEGDDTLLGQDGNDLLGGGGGDDVIDGGEGDDVLVGSSGADTQTGANGADTFRGTIAELAGDTITDFSIGDRIAIVDATLAGFTFSHSAALLSFAGSALTLTGSEALSFRVQAPAAGEAGIDLVINAVPFINSNGGGTDAAFSVTENQTAATIVSASDADASGALVYSIAGGTDAARFTINAGTGELTFLAAPDFEAPGDADGNNIYSVIVRASDGYAHDQQTLAINVTNLADSVGVTVAGTAGNDTISPTKTAPGQPKPGHDDDTLFGLGGNDKLDGGGGADTMFGGIGNDIYTLDNAGDTVNEGIDEGVDTMESAVVSLTLAENVEKGTLKDAAGGAVSLAIVGNALGNTLKGNGAANLLDSGEGDDIIAGNGGNDILLGGSGKDNLAGGAGEDRLTGGSEADQFKFDAEAFDGEIDTILDFSKAQKDKINLSAIDADDNAANGNSKFAFLGTGLFTVAAGQVRYEQVDGNTHVLADIDGDGAADLEILLIGITNLASSDFVL